jgi:MoaA/NifB/PqqE/SkfB family radical SAM enzyme
MSKFPKYGCVMPFHHMAIRPDGRIFPCCVFRQEESPEDLNVSHPDPFNHDFMKYLRKKVSNDEYIHGCRYCYEEENVSGRSMRIDLMAPWMNDFGLPTQEEGKGKRPMLTNIDLSISNVCNNKCRMCGPQLSTHWYSDAKKLGQDIPKGIVSKNTIIDEYDLSELRFIKLLGGEPLMEQKRLIQILKKCTLEKLTIMLVTNTTLVPCKELLDLLLKCQKVNVQFSIDSYGTLNDFLRKGSNWQDTVKSIEWFKQYFTHLSVHSVCNIYNINKVHELIDYCKDNDLYQSYVMIDGPKWMQPRNLHEKVKPYVLEYIDSIIDNYDVTYKKFFRIAQNELKQEGDFGFFVRNDAQLNKLRDEHWMDKNPELWSKLEPLIVPEIF